MVNILKHKIHALMKENGAGAKTLFQGAKFTCLSIMRGPEPIGRSLGLIEEEHEILWAQRGRRAILACVVKALSTY